MREGYDAIITACESLGEGSKPMDHVKKLRARASTTGSPVCTRPPRGTSTATASPTAAPSVRIPGRSSRTGRGYIEDRRPNANVDPYVVTRLIVDTCCTALEKADQV